LKPFHLCLARRFAVHKPFSNNLGYGEIKPIPVRDRILAGATIVKPELLFVQISKQVKRFHADAGSVDAALEQTPQVLQPISPPSAVLNELKIF
jgi:hypothetical protein